MRTWIFGYPDTRLPCWKPAADGKAVLCLAGLWVGAARHSEPAAGPFLLTTAPLPANRPAAEIENNPDDLTDLNGVARVALLRAFTSTTARPGEGGAGQGTVAGRGQG